MNIKRRREDSDLSESSQQIPQIPIQQQRQQMPYVDTTQEELVMRNRSKQFNFDCGAFMGRIDMPINNRFGLKWHFDNSKSLEEFINSVGEFVAVTGNKITKNDIEKLTFQYNTYNERNRS